MSTVINQRIDIWKCNVIMVRSARCFGVFVSVHVCEFQIFFFLPLVCSSWTRGLGRLVSSWTVHSRPVCWQAVWRWCLVLSATRKKQNTFFNLQRHGVIFATSSINPNKEQNYICVLAGLSQHVVAVNYSIRVHNTSNLSTPVAGGASSASNMWAI